MTEVVVAKQLPAKTDFWDDIVKQLAADIGADTVAYVEVMYPEAIKATSSTFKLSLRNHIYNEIMAVVKMNDDAESVVARLERRRAFRKEWLATYRKMRRKKCKHGIREHECGLCDDERRAR